MIFHNKDPKFVVAIVSIAFFAQLHAVNARADEATPNMEAAQKTESAPPAQFDDDWHFLVAIPLWAPSISGDLQTPRFPDIPVNASFSDIISHFTFGVMAHAEARKSRIGFGLDLLYVNLNDTLETNRSIPALQNFSLGLKQIFAEGFTFYRVIQDGDARNPYLFDLLAGVRYYWTEATINTLSATLDWADLMLGLRGQIPLGDHFNVRGRSDFAFIGSKFTWNLIGEAAWVPSDRWTFSAGYRAMNIDYENNSTQRIWNLNYHGPVLTAALSW